MQAEGERRAPVRVLLLMDTARLPRWAAEIVEQMVASPAIELVGVVYDADARTGEVLAPAARSMWQRLVRAWQHRDSVALRYYLKFDARRYPAIGPDPFEDRDLTAALAPLPSIEARPRRTMFSDYLDARSLEQMRALRPDVVIRFGFRILRGDILHLPVHGVWSFHHGDNRVNRGGPAGFWEVFHGWPATGAVLQRLSEDLDGGATLARTWVATSQISVNQNRIDLFRAAAPLLMRKLIDLHERGEAALAPPAGDSAFVPYSAPLFVAPTLAVLARGVMRIGLRLLRRKWDASRAREQWQLEYSVDSRRQEGNLTPQSAAFRGKPVVPPADRFWADPFVVTHLGRTWVFFEELLYSDNVGRIAVFELGINGPVLPPRVVLQRPYHLSYPLVFSYGGAWYMMPEMAGHTAQEVYRAADFPFAWSLDRELSFGQLVVDPTLVEHDGRWWLFVGTQPSIDSAINELSIFFGDSPLGPWQPHARNPVLSDARGARPAGQIFRVGDDLIRPAQDGTPAYGSAICFKRILQLSETEYQEELVGRLDPRWREGLAGTHTVNAAGAVTVLDVRVRHRR
jgi:hypothetical protein